MDLSLAAPLLALVIGTISLFTAVKTSPHRKGLIVVPLSLQLLTCLVALRNGRASGLEKADLKARFDTLSVENRTISRALDALREFLAIIISRHFVTRRPEQVKTVPSLVRDRSSSHQLASSQYFSNFSTMAC